jgi:hypothetical protein
VTPHKQLYSATMDPRFVGDVNGPGPDLALVEIDDLAVELPPMELARGRPGQPDRRAGGALSCGWLPVVCRDPLSNGGA